MNYRTGHEKVGKVHVKHIYEIGKMQQRNGHLKHLPLESICRTVAASASSMGLEVVRD